MRYLGIALVHLWRWTFGLLTPSGTCKYHPSCSQYALDAFREFGLVRGSTLAGWRLLRCNPWSHGGVDYARDQTLFPLLRSRGLSGKWSRWMTRGTRHESRTQGAPICRHIDATEDAASRRVTPVRRPDPFSGQAPGKAKA